jgi:macrolide-specific efflux system membrane fusion protein
MKKTSHLKTSKAKRNAVMIGLPTAVLVVGLLIVKMGGSHGRGIQYQNSKVVRGNVKTTILSTGVVAPENRLDLKPPVAGRIEKVLVAEGDHVRSGQILAWMSSTERATLIDTARAKGADEVKYWEDSYKMTPILAPSRGLIILKSADAGQTVTQTDIVLSMSDRLIVKANVDETDLAQVVLGQRVNMVLDAFPDQNLPSKVFHIGYDAKTVNNVTTYEVDVAADQIPDFMKSGMTANVTFLIAEKDDALLIPAAAIHREHHKSFVMVPDPQSPGTTQQREVKLGISDGKRVEVTEGLAEGDTVLTVGMRSLAAKSEQNNTNPFMPSHGPPPGGGRH